MPRLILAVALAFVLLPAAPADAASRVTLTNSDGKAVIDPTYTTTLTVRGRGFQSIRNGHGGIYVLFGVVKGAWRPSAGGTSGGSYLTVPDSQSKNNAGYAKFVAFPGSDTAGSANGGTIAADGSWSTKIAVPGAVFTTYDKDQKPVRIDCRVSVCGVITIGAHGVSNSHNESFTRVRFGTVVGASFTTPTGSTTTGSTVTGAPATTPSVQAPPAVAGVAAVPALEVDRASAKPGRVLSFSAEGLDPGSQVSATFDDGRAGVGPLTVGASGQLAGVLRLPTNLTTGTYELRIVGGTKSPTVRFAVVAPEVATVEEDQAPIVFAAVGAGVLVLALVAAALIRRKRARRA
jgi:hypothetical protein